MAAFMPALYALFVWWFATGVVFLLCQRQRWTGRVNVAALALVPVFLYVLANTSMQTTILGSYACFTVAIALWGTQEITLLTGFITGPRPLSCPPDARGFARASFAFKAILFHEIALVASGLAVWVVTLGAPNQIGLLTFLVLWIMRISAKLNLFFGVPALNDELLPKRIAFLRSYFRQGKINGLFPITTLLGVGASLLFVDYALTAPTNALRSGYILLATLMGLAVLEHLFMLVRLPTNALWTWSSSGRRDCSSQDADSNSLSLRSLTQPF